MPITANYYVTLRCNQRCTFCNIPHTNNGSPSREPTMDQVRSNLRDLKRLGVIALDVTGGEPLLYRHLVEMLDYAKKLRFFTTVTTNGMLYPKFAEQLVGKVNALLFSIDSTDPEEHDRIRAMKSFHLAIEALATARRLKQTLYISHVVTNESYDRVDEMVRFAKDQGAILYLNPCFSFFGNEGLDPDKAAGLERYFGQPGVILDPAQLALIGSGGNKTDDPVCRAVSSTVVISPENELWLPCSHFRQQGIPIKNDLYDLYTRSETVQHAKRMEGRHAFCEGCTVYCYMRSSLQWKYPIKSAMMAGVYVRERLRQRVRYITNPPNPAPIAVASARRHLPLADPGE
jgi:MoaA/NifB/PqqE/SkfB family radical SAM enzyme